MSISYELAKELKDAGYPQKAGMIWLFLDTRKVFDSVKDVWKTRRKEWKSLYCKNPEEFNGKNVWLAKPSLEELIEAVPKTVFSEDWNTHCEFQLWYVKEDYPKTDFWRAVYHWIDRTTEKQYDSDGATPTEAVARLWLALNKKV